MSDYEDGANFFSCGEVTADNKAFNYLFNCYLANQGHPKIGQYVSIRHTRQEVIEINEIKVLLTETPAQDTLDYGNK